LPPGVGNAQLCCGQLWASFDFPGCGQGRGKTKSEGIGANPGVEDLWRRRQDLQSHTAADSFGLNEDGNTDLAEVSERARD